MVDHPKTMLYSDWRETFRLSDINDDTCKLVIVTDDQIEVLRRALKAARKRSNWIDDEGPFGYTTPEDGDWDDVSSMLDDLEYRLMSACDYVTLDDVNERVGIGTDAPATSLEVAGTLRVSQPESARYRLDVVIANGTARMYVYDDVGLVYIPLTLYTSKTTLGGLRALASGNVGVGKEPSYTVDISGMLACSSNFGCNGATPRGKVPAGADATDLDSAITLVNQLKLALVNNGICS
jgi:hypothetical protein